MFCSTNDIADSFDDGADYSGVTNFEYEQYPGLALSKKRNRYDLEVYEMIESHKKKKQRTFENDYNSRTDYNPSIEDRPFG